MYEIRMAQFNVPNSFMVSVIDTAGLVSGAGTGDENGLALQWIRRVAIHGVNTNIEIECIIKYDSSRFNNHFLGLCHPAQAYPEINFNDSLLKKDKSQEEIKTEYQ